MCTFCQSESCSGQCRDGWPFVNNRPFYNPPFTTPFNRNCVPVLPPVPPYPCPTCNPCLSVGCLQTITTDCVVTTASYPCIGNSAIGTNLTAILGTLNSLVCNISNQCQVKVSSLDQCCDYLGAKVTSLGSTVTITTPINPNTGCQTLNLEVATTPTNTSPVVILNSNQDGTPSYSIPLPSPFTTGDLIVDFDGQASNSIANATPTFDFNLKGNRVVFVDSTIFTKYTYDSTTTTGVYSIQPPKFYLGNLMNAQVGEDFTYEITLVVNCNNISIPEPTSNYLTDLIVYIGSAAVLASSMSTSPVSPTYFKLKLEIKRITNTSGLVICYLDLYSGGAFFSGGGHTLLTGTPTVSELNYFELTPTTSFDVDTLPLKLVLSTSTSALSGLQFQIVDSKITLNKF